MIVRVLRRAEADLVALHRFVARTSVPRANAVMDQILDAIDALGRFPRRGARPRDVRLRRAGFRYLVCGNHLVFYKVIRKQVRVYRVLHAKRSWQAIL